MHMASSFPCPTRVAHRHGENEHPRANVIPSIPKHPYRMYFECQKCNTFHSWECSCLTAARWTRHSLRVCLREVPACRFMVGMRGGRGAHTDDKHNAYSGDTIHQHATVLVRRPGEECYCDLAACALPGCWLLRRGPRPRCRAADSSPRPCCTPDPFHARSPSSPEPAVPEVFPRGPPMQQHLPPVAHSQPTRRLPPPPTAS